MYPTIQQLTELTDPYAYCPLECDGLSKVLSFVLGKHAINHTVYSGTLAPQGEDGIPHVWIELETDLGRRTLDYRVRQWFRDRPAIPHGLFDPTETGFVYTEEPVTFPPLTGEQFVLLGAPIIDLLACLEVLPRPLLLTLGYRQPYSEAVLAFLTSRGFPVLDIRERAGSRWNAAYNKKRLEERYPLYYSHLRNLGNIKHNEEGAPVEFVDLEAGLQETREIIYGDAAGQGAVYLCACSDWLECHRNKAAKHLLTVAPEVIVVHIQANGSLVLQQANSRSELFMLGREAVGPEGMFRVVFDDGQVLSTYNPMLVERLTENQDKKSIKQCYCELPLADLSRENVTRQSQNAETVVSATSTAKEEPA